MGRYLRYIFFLFWIPSTLQAQDSGRFHVMQYGTEDGLPSNGIKGLQWDKKNRFLWIATEAGMIRYNGITFKPYTSDDNPHITNERILFLIRNNAGTIYTADNMGNIFYVRDNHLSFLEKKNISGNPVSNTVLLTVAEKFYSHVKTIPKGPFALQFDDVMPESDTSVFIGHSDSLYYFSFSMQSPVTVLPELTVSHTFKIGPDLYIKDTKNRFWLLNRTGRSFTTIPVSFPSYDDHNSRFIWENGMEAPLQIQQEKAWKIIKTSTGLGRELICDQVPLHVLIRYAQYDEAFKTLFIGTDSKGMIIIRKNLVTQVRKEMKTAAERTSYYSQMELPDNTILTNEGHLFSQDPSKAAAAPFSGKFSNSTYRMGDSLFWFVQHDTTDNNSHLFSYNFKNGRKLKYPKVNEKFSQLVMTSSGGKLYLANEEGISRLDNDTIISLHRYTDSQRQMTHFEIREIKPGVLGIASCYALMQYDINARKLDTLFAEGNYCVRTIWTYKDYLFFGTYGNGLYISHNGVVKPLPLDKNNYLLFTHCFVEDGTGFCWISTNRGLFKASISDMIHAYETNDPQIYYHYFGRNDGMVMTEMNGGCTPCGLKMKNNIISFPTMEGLLWVNPDLAVPVLPDGDIFIDEVFANNKRIDPELFSGSTIDAFQHDVLIRIGFSAWSNKENIYLQYRLNNETDWKMVNTDNSAQIQLGNLESGNYTLYIRKLNGFGVDNYSYKNFTFTVPSPWYQRWWFYILSIVLVYAAISLYLRYRTRQYEIRQLKLEEQVSEKTKELQEQNEVLEKNNSIKTRLISIISHDIVTPLKFLNVAGKNLIEKRKLMNEELQVETIKEITNTSQELQLLSTNILNWIKYQNENRRLIKEHFNLHEMVSQVLGLLQSLARQKNLVIENKVDPELEIHQFYEPLKILVYNLLTNAIHFTEKGSITVSAVKTDTYITLSVKDEGIGMSPEQIQRLMAEEVVITSANVDNKKGHGLGYLIIKDLLKTMDATLDIQSKKGAGATVSIQLFMK